MNRALLAVPLLFAACSQQKARSTGAPFEIIFTADAKWLQEEGQKEMESALARFPQIDLVYAQNDPMAFGAFQACKSARRTGIKFIGVDALPNEGVRYVQEGVLDATVEYPTGGKEAVDLALFALHGRALPKDIKLGTRVFTKENLARGGDPIEAPGAKLIAELREKYAQDLKPPATDQVWVIGLSQCNLGEPWRRQMNADIEAAVKQYPQLRLIQKDAQNDLDKQGVQIDELVTQSVHAILVSPKETGPLVRQVRRAIAKKTPVIVLDRGLGGTADDYTCFIGGDNVMIARAAGEQAKKLLPGASKDKPAMIVEIKGLTTSDPSRHRHEGFVQALGIQ